MPFTPLHFGPHACVALPLRRYVDLPVFLLANVVVDIEPLLVLTFNLSYPLHGYCHTLLIGGLLGFLLATIAFPFRGVLRAAMRRARLPYEPSFMKMAIAGVAGAWLHVLFDATIYHEIDLFWPIYGNPLYGLSSYQALSRLCLACFIPAFAIYVFIVVHTERRTADS